MFTRPPILCGYTTDPRHTTKASMLLLRLERGLAQKTSGKNTRSCLGVEPVRCEYDSITEYMCERVPGVMCERLPGVMCERVPGVMCERVPGVMCERLPGVMCAYVGSWAFLPPPPPYTPESTGERCLSRGRSWQRILPLASGCGSRW